MLRSNGQVAVYSCAIFFISLINFLYKVQDSANLCVERLDIRRR